MRNTAKHSEQTTRHKLFKTLAKMFSLETDMGRITARSRHDFYDLNRYVVRSVGPLPLGKASQKCWQLRTASCEAEALSLPTSDGLFV